MARYHASSTQGGTAQAADTTGKTLLSLTSVTGNLRRAWVYDFEFGTISAPDDLVVSYQAIRCTSVGSGGTAVTPRPLDEADIAATTVATANQTSEPTTAAVTLRESSTNQRTTYRWVASPGGELVIPGTNVAGIAFRVRGQTAGFTGTATVSVHFFE